MNPEILFVKPSRFEDTLKYMDYISNDVILHINFHSLEKKISQRVMDFVSGAIFIKEGNIVVLGENVICVIPKGKTYIMDYKTMGETVTEVTYDEEEEIRPNF